MQPHQKIGPVLAHNPANHVEHSKTEVVVLDPGRRSVAVAQSKGIRRLPRAVVDADVDVRLARALAGFARIPRPHVACSADGMNGMAAVEDGDGPCLLLPILKGSQIFSLTQHGIIQTYLHLAFVAVNAGVHQAWVFIALELVHRIVHQGAVENPQTDQKLKVCHCQAGHFPEQAGLQLGNHILQRSLPIIGQIQEDGNAGGKLDEFLLNLLAQALVLLFFLAQFLFFYFKFFILSGLLPRVISPFALARSSDNKYTFYFIQLFSKAWGKHRRNIV